MPKNILVLGAGKSSAALIRFLIAQSEKENIKIIVADASFAAAEGKTNRHPNTAALELDIENAIQRAELIDNSDVIISLLPPHMHASAAADAVKFGKHFINASYLDETIKDLDWEAKKNGSLVLTELGLDPGIDHLINKKMIDEIRHSGGQITALRSFCGGLVAPNFLKDNPWKYKFTWNPRNVVLAGQGAARLLNKGEVKHIPASRTFETLEKIDLEGVGNFEAYPNRDSLKYVKPYGIEGAATVVRGTLRYPGFCQKWNSLIKTGLTDNTLEIGNYGLTAAGLLRSFCPTGLDVDAFLKSLGIKSGDEIYSALEWLGLFNEVALKPKRGTAADFLLSLLEEKWKLESEDLDYVVQYNEVSYEKEGRHFVRSAYFGITGENATYTAMAKTVGLPLGLAAMLLIKDKITLSGVQLPIHAQLYEPLLEQFKEQGIDIKESEREVLKQG